MSYCCISSCQKYAKKFIYLELSEKGIKYYKRKYQFGHDSGYNGFCLNCFKFYFPIEGDFNYCYWLGKKVSKAEYKKAIKEYVILCI